MPILIKKIEANVLDNFIDEVELIQPLEGQVGQGDYINLNGFIAYLQDYSQVETTEEFPLLTTYGLKSNREFIELKISY